MKRPGLHWKAFIKPWTVKPAIRIHGWGSPPIAAAAIMTPGLPRHNPLTLNRYFWNRIVQIVTTQKIGRPQFSNIRCRSRRLAAVVIPPIIIMPILILQIIQDLSPIVPPVMNPRYGRTSFIIMGFPDSHWRALIIMETVPVATRMVM